MSLVEEDYNKQDKRQKELYERMNKINKRTNEINERSKELTELEDLLIELTEKVLKGENAINKKEDSDAQKAVNFIKVENGNNAVDAIKAAQDEIPEARTMEADFFLAVAVVGSLDESKKANLIEEIVTEQLRKQYQWAEYLNMLEMGMNEWEKTLDEREKTLDEIDKVISEILSEWEKILMEKEASDVLKEDDDIQTEYSADEKDALEAINADALEVKKRDDIARQMMAKLKKN